MPQQTMFRELKEGVALQTATAKMLDSSDAIRVQATLGAMASKTDSAEIVEMLIERGTTITTPELFAFMDWINRIPTRFPGNQEIATLAPAVFSKLLMYQIPSGTA